MAKKAYNGELNAHCKHLESEQDMEKHWDNKENQRQEYMRKWYNPRFYIFESECWTVRKQAE